MQSKRHLQYPLDGSFCQVCYCQKSNCQWATLRQQANNKRIRKNNKTGVEGVSTIDEGIYRYYRARATIDGKRVALGCYELSPSGFEAAVEAVKKAKQLAEVLL